MEVVVRVRGERDGRSRGPLTFGQGSATQGGATESPPILLMEDGSAGFVLEDGSGVILMEQP